jgi:excisionase family DNA binding protein
MRADQPINASRQPSRIQSAGDLPLVLSAGETARLLGVSKSLVYDLIARGDLPGLRLGRRVVVPTQAFLAFLAGE